MWIFNGCNQLSSSPLSLQQLCYRRDHNRRKQRTCSNSYYKYYFFSDAGGVTVRRCELLHVGIQWTAYRFKSGLLPYMKFSWYGNNYVYIKTQITLYLYINPYTVYISVGGICLPHERAAMAIKLHPTDYATVNYIVIYIIHLVT